MRVINFLPDDYLRRRGARVSNFVCLGMAGATVLILGLVVGVCALRAYGAACVRTTVERQYAEASRKIEDLKQLEERKAGLVHKVELSTALLERVPRSHILAQLTNHLPPETSLTALTMQVQTIKVPLTEADKTAAAKLAPATGPKGGKPAAGSKAQQQMRTVTQVQFRLDGVARTDVQVAGFISKIQQDPLFSEVNLQFSEEFPHTENMLIRRFQLCFALSEIAEKVLDGTKADEAAVPEVAGTKGTP